MVGAHRLLSVGQYEQQMAGLGVREQSLQKPQGLGIGPLEVVEEQKERVLLGRTDMDESEQRLRETVSGGIRRQVGELRQLTQDRPQRRDQLHERASRDSERTRELLPPARELLLRKREELPRQAVECLDDRGERLPTTQLVELPPEEVPAQPDDIGLESFDQRGLADARGTSDQHQASVASIGFSEEAS